MKKFLRVLSIISILIILCFMLIGCSYVQPETTVVKATITDKEHIESYTDFGYYFDAWKGKYRWKFKNFPAEYNVTVQYNDIVETFDSKSLYETVEIGNTIDIELTTYFDSEGKVENQTISIIN